MIHQGVRSPDAMMRPAPRQPPPMSPQHFAPMSTRSAGMMPGGASTMRGRARVQQQRAQESMMWPNPWLRRNWHAEMPLDLNAEPPVDKEAEENEMLLEEPEPEENKFKPAFEMDLNALVQSLWTPPLPAANPYATRRPQFVRQRSTSPPPMATPPKPTLPSHNVPHSVRDVRRANHIPRYDDVDMRSRHKAPDPRMHVFDHRRGMPAPPIDSWFDEDDEPSQPPRRYEDPRRLQESTRSRPLDPRVLREMDARQQRQHAPRPNLRRMQTSPPYDDGQQYMDDRGRPRPMPMNHPGTYDPRMHDVDPRTRRVYEPPRAIPREMDAFWDDREEQFDHRKRAYDPRAMDPRVASRMMDLRTDPRAMRRMESDPRSAAMDPRARMAPPKQHREPHFHTAPHYQSRDPRAYVMGPSPPRSSPFLAPQFHDAPPPAPHAPVMTRSEPDRAAYHDGVDF